MIWKSFSANNCVRPSYIWRIRLLAQAAPGSVPFVIRELMISRHWKEATKVFAAHVIPFRLDKCRRCVLFRVTRCTWIWILVVFAVDGFGSFGTFLHDKILPFPKGIWNCKAGSKQKVQECGSSAPRASLKQRNKCRMQLQMVGG